MPVPERDRHQIKTAHETEMKSILKFSNSYNSFVIYVEKLLSVTVYLQFY